MAVAASAIINRVRAQLADERTVKRWSDVELLRWLSDAQRAIVSAVPAATSLVATRALSAGTRQTLPSGGYKLLKVIRNLSSGGVAGAPITQVMWDLLDWQYTDWHSMTPTAAVKAYTFDPQDPAAFYVFPPNDGTGSVQLNYSVLPVELTATSDNISVQDIYQNPLFDYVMFRAHSKDADFAAGRELAQAYLATFTSYVSVMGAQTAPTGG